MYYDGLEIDMLNVGNGDCILVTRWSRGQSAPERVLIDGGVKGSYDTARDFLTSRGITYVDHVVCTHPHADHAGGLIPLVEDTSLTFGIGWMHLPLIHVSLDEAVRSFSTTATVSGAVALKEAVATSTELFTAFNARGVVVQEPFAGRVIGSFLTVCGPTREYYDSLLSGFTTSWFAKAMEAITDPEDDEELPAVPETSPENNSSVIMLTEYGGLKYLFTADAGVPALSIAVDAYDLRDLHWMQLPHHGSRHNISLPLIEHFRPTYGFVSAEGSRKHPRRAVVNAFKDVETSVYSTHYPRGANVHIESGTVPNNVIYTPAIPLWDAYGY
jgi:hypothetical protein